MPRPVLIPSEKTPLMGWAEVPIPTYVIDSTEALRYVSGALFPRVHFIPMGKPPTDISDMLTEGPRR